jgi:hypothetical protein
MLGHAIGTLHGVDKGNLRVLGRVHECFEDEPKSTLFQKSWTRDKTFFQDNTKGSEHVLTCTNSNPVLVEEYNEGLNGLFKDWELDHFKISI